VNNGQSAAVQVLQSPRDDERVEVSMEQHDGVERVVLRQSTWTEGLGWCCQKTISLDTEQLDDLHRALTVARHRIARQRAESGQIHEPAQVIQLPTVA
jgi:hypothetical protein